MKNILKTLILTGLVLFAGTTLILSCTHDEGGLAGHPANGPNTYIPAGGSGDGSNPFVGNWSGTVILSGQSTPATCNITETTWALNVPAAPEYNTQGTYTYSGSGNSVNISDPSSGTAGTAIVSGNTLIINIASGPVAGGSGTFTKAGSNGTGNDTGSDSSSKPAKLSSGATVSQANAKLDEIIAYPGTPYTTKMYAEATKTGLSEWPSNYPVGAEMVATINSLIDDIP
jgi:hypothetical protein